MIYKIFNHWAAIIYGVVATAHDANSSSKSSIEQATYEIYHADFYRTGQEGI